MKFYRNFNPVKSSNYASGTSLGRQQCSGYIFLTTTSNPEDGSNTASETLVSNHQTTRCNSPENHDFYFSVVKASNYESCLLLLQNNRYHSTHICRCTLNDQSRHFPCNILVHNGWENKQNRL